MTIKTGFEIEKDLKLNECLLKSFENLMVQQNKMDNKAYIFIGFLIFIFNSFFNEPNNKICLYSIMLFTISLPLICSLIPIATTLGINWVKFIKKEDNKNEHNIFYYMDICGLTKERFIQILNTEYGIQHLSLSDKKLIEQIITNSEILNAKVIGHIWFFRLLVIGIIICIVINIIKNFA